MVDARIQRRLAAILAADVAGYSRLMEEDEAGTLAVLNARRREILTPSVAQYHGRVVKLMGDGVLVEFGSAVDAVECAIELQKRFAEANQNLPESRGIVLRIGINLGDVIIDGSDLYGGGVNVAARLEGLAEPGGICVSSSVHDQVRRKLQCDFDDLGPQAVKNIAEPVRVFRVRQKEQIRAQGTLSLPAKPSIAVLPFQNLSADPEQAFFADGLTEDIITALSRISGLWVIARRSTFTYKGRPADVKQVARELGVRYVMEGSVRRAGERLRITTQLIDAQTTHEVWAERYDRPLADLFDIQDEITRSVAAETQTQLQLAEAAVGDSRPFTNSKARDFAVRAWARLLDQTPEAIAEASGLVEEAMRLEPLNPVAVRASALLYFSRLWFGDIPRDPENMARGSELARTALRLAPRDEYAHLVMAYAHAYAADGQLEEAIAECERGLEINPNCSIIYANMGAYQSALGRPQASIEACRLALRLNPRDPSNFWRHHFIAVAYFVAGDYAACLSDSKRLSRSRPLLASGIMWAAAAAGMEDAKEARAAVDYCLAQRPALRVASVAPAFMLRFARNEDHERLLALLRQAGLPE